MCSYHLSNLLLWINPAPKAIANYNHYNKVNEWKTKHGSGRYKNQFRVYQTSIGGCIACMWCRTYIKKDGLIPSVQ